MAISIVECNWKEELKMPKKNVTSPKKNVTSPKKNVIETEKVSQLLLVVVAAESVVLVELV